MLPKFGPHYAILYSLPLLSFSSQYSLVTHHIRKILLQTEGQTEREIDHVFGSSVGIATRYELDGPGIESRWGTIFSAPVQTDPGAHPVFYTMGTVSFLGVKRPGRGVDHPPQSRIEVKERVELYLYSPSFVACYRVNFIFFIFI